MYTLFSCFSKEMVDTIAFFCSVTSGLGDRQNEALRGPAAILFISRDTCSDSIAKLSRACFHGVSHNYRAIRCKMGYRTDVPV